MKTILFSLFLSAFLVLGCAETPVSPIKSDSKLYSMNETTGNTPISANIDDLPVVKTIHSKSKLIYGDIGGDIVVKANYRTEDGRRVTVDCKLSVPQWSFPGEAFITFTVDSKNCFASFSPHMVFDTPVKLQMKFEGIDLEELQLVSGQYDFVFIDVNGNIEPVPYQDFDVDESGGQICLGEALLSHFSRYAFVR